MIFQEAINRQSKGNNSEHVWRSTFDQINGLVVWFWWRPGELLSTNRFLHLISKWTCFSNFFIVFQLIHVLYLCYLIIISILFCYLIIISILIIFASQGLRSALLTFTLGIARPIFEATRWRFICNAVSGSCNQSERALQKTHVL